MAKGKGKLKKGYKALGGAQYLEVSSGKIVSASTALTKGSSGGASKTRKRIRKSMRSMGTLRKIGGNKRARRYIKVRQGHIPKYVTIDGRKLRVRGRKGKGMKRDLSLQSKRGGISRRLKKSINLRKGDYFEVRTKVGRGGKILGYV